MARTARLDLYHRLLDVGVLPLFYNAQVETAADIVDACRRGGANLVEFTNRGELAYPVFSQLVQRFFVTDPAVILGVGSIQDAPTAALFIAAGAEFIVGPNLNPEIARLCNRRKIAYIPGAGTEYEISLAEEMGAEIVKVFPGSAAGGPGFVRSVMGPCPWHRLMPTGGVDATQASITEWIKAGAAAVGIGSKLVSKEIVNKRDFDGLASLTEQCIRWVRLARGSTDAMG